MGAPHTTTRAWESKKRKWNGNGIETEWNGNGGNERKQEMAKLDYNNAINMHSRVSEHWKDSEVPSATTLKLFAITLQKKRTDTVMPCK